MERNEKVLLKKEGIQFCNGGKILWKREYSDDSKDYIFGNVKISGVKILAVFYDTIAIFSFEEMKLIILDHGNHRVYESPMMGKCPENCIIFYNKHCNEEESKYKSKYQVIMEKTEQVDILSIDDNFMLCDNLLITANGKTLAIGKLSVLSEKFLIISSKNKSFVFANEVLIAGKICFHLTSENRAHAVVLAATGFDFSNIYIGSNGAVYKNLLAIGKALTGYGDLVHKYATCDGSCIVDNEQLALLFVQDGKYVSFDFEGNKEELEDYEIPKFNLHIASGKKYCLYDADYEIPFTQSKGFMSVELTSLIDDFDMIGDFYMVDDFEPIEFFKKLEFLTSCFHKDSDFPKIFKQWTSFEFKGIEITFDNFNRKITEKDGNLYELLINDSKIFFESEKSRVVL